MRILVRLGFPEKEKVFKEVHMDEMTFSRENTGKEKRDKHTCAGALIIIKLLSFADISQIRYHSDFLQYQQAASLSLKPL